MKEIISPNLNEYYSSVYELHSCKDPHTQTAVNIMSQVTCQHNYGPTPPIGCSFVNVSISMYSPDVCCVDLFL